MGWQDPLSPKGRSGLARPLLLPDALAAYAFAPQLAQDGGGMFGYGSGDVSLEGASFSECTAARVRLPRPHTLASPAHAHSHAITAPEAAEEGRGTMGWQDPLSPKGRSGLARPLSLADALPA